MPQPFRSGHEALCPRNSKLIVSRHKDLLDVMDWTKPGAVDFQTRFPLVRILTPVAFLSESGESL